MFTLLPFDAALYSGLPTSVAPPWIGILCVSLSFVFDLVRGGTSYFLEHPLYIHSFSQQSELATCMVLFFKDPPPHLSSNQRPLAVFKSL
ncbi:hypothetical protein K432DRAFT_72988 [Lepidopterella palustris CBS 459.81]|uniref:Uncharacterized protein n=1 Tax=Lepidopterella palustris CBS 459.81 TaxID=1314670 RepID=A0A8E2EJK9_9PEZI|nr:hypothetical protein K432DRAFT_72988 [Lepidopterella palustris CBS 459.81]